MQIGVIEGILKLRDDFSSALDKAAANVDRVGNRIAKSLDTPVKHSGKIVAGLAAGFVLLGKSIHDAATEAETTMAQLEAAVLSTGHVAGLSAKQISNMAGRLEDLTGAEDEVIIRAQTLLLAFQNVHRNAFEPATLAALNLSRRGFGPLDTTIKMVGKALNSPVKGLLALERQLGKLDPSVKASIKSLAEHGRIAEAQGLILDEIEKKVGGAAEAFRNTLPGAIAALRAEWGNLLEVVAETGGGGGMFRTSIEGMVRALQWLQENWHLLESATFIVLGNISERIAEFVAFAIGAFEKVAGFYQRIQNLIPDVAFFGSADKSRKFADSLVKGAERARKSVLQLGRDLKTGFETKADDAASATDDLGESLAEGAYTATEVSERVKQLAKELANLRAELILAARHAREMLSTLLSGIPGATTALAERQELEIAYLKDLEKFGKAAADGLQILRLAASAAKRELAAFEELERLNDKFISDAAERIKDQVRTDSGKMEDFTRQVFDASFVQWEEFNEKVKAAIRARADERIELEAEVWASTAGGFERAIASAKAWQTDLQRRIQDAVDHGVLSAKRGHELILKSREALAKREAEILADEVGGALDALGRFIAQIDSELGSLLGAAGGAISASSAFSKDQSWAALFGAAGAWWTAFIELANFINASGSKGMQWFTSVGQTGGQVGVTGAGTNVSATNMGKYQELARQADELGTSISNAINDLLDMMGASLTKFASFSIAEEAGFVVVQFEGQFKKWFGNIEEAMSYAIAEALRTSEIVGLDDAIKTALRNTDADTLEELQQQLEFAFDFSRLGVNEAALSLRDLANDAALTARMATELGLSVQKVGEEFARNASTLRDEITGVITDPYQRDVKRMEAFNAEIVRLTNQYTQLLTLHDVEIAQLKESIALTLAQIKVERTLSETERLALVADQERLKFLMGEIAALQSLLANLPKPIDISEIPRGRGASGGEDRRAGVRDFLDTRAFELSLATLSEYSRRIAEIGRQYDEQLEQAGKDVALRGQLIELKERELALLAKEQKDTIANRFRDFLGLVTPFDQVRETAAALIKDIEESPFGNERKARMIGRVLEDVERQIEQLAQQAAVSLFGELIGDLEKYGADEQLQLAARQASALIEHTLKMEHYRTEIAILRAAGKLAPEVLQALDDAFKFLEGIDPLSLFETPSGEVALRIDPAWLARQEEATETVSDLQKAMQSALETLQDMERDALDPLTRDLLELEDRFKPLYEALGHTARVAQAHAAQTELIMRRHFGATMDLLDSLDTSDLSPLRTIDKFEKAQADFFDGVADVLSGDFARLEDIPSLFEEAIGLAQEVSPRGSEAFRSIFNSMKSALEQLAAMSGLPTGTLNRLASGMSVGNLLLPDAFNLSAHAQAQAMPVVDVIGKHSDRQVVILRSVESKLGSIDARTGELVAIGHSTNSVLRNVI